MYVWIIISISTARKHYFMIGEKQQKTTRATLKTAMLKNQSNTMVIGRFFFFFFFYFAVQKSFEPSKFFFFFLTVVQNQYDRALISSILLQYIFGPS